MSSIHAADVMLEVVLSGNGPGLTESPGTEKSQDKRIIDMEACFFRPLHSWKDEDRQRISSVQSLYSWHSSGVSWSKDSSIHNPADAGETCTRLKLSQPPSLL